MIKLVVASGDIALLTWLQQQLRLQPDQGLHDAAANGHLKMVQLLYDRYVDRGRSTGILLKAAEHGREDIVRWIIGHDWERKKATEYITSVGGEASLCIHAAAVNGHLGIAKFLHARVDKIITVEEEQVAMKRFTEVFRQLKELLGDHHGGLIGSVTMLEAAKKGQLDVVQWLVSEFRCDRCVDLFSYGWNEDYPTAMDAAAFFGHLKVVQYLHRIAPDYDMEISRDRKRKRSIMERVLGINRRDGIRCTTAAMDGAARNKHLDVVKWLHANRSEGCTTLAMDRAALNGDLQMVPWLHTHRSEGCSTKAMDAAAAAGHLKTLKWLHENTRAGCTHKAMDIAGKFGRLEVLKWLNEHTKQQCTTDALDGAARRGPFEVVEWLHTNREEGCTTDAMDYAAACGFLDIVKYLHQNRKEGCTKKAMVWAAAKGHLKVMVWLHENRPGDCSAPAIDHAVLARDFEAAFFLSRVRGEKISRNVVVDDEVRQCFGLLDWIEAGCPSHPTDDEFD